MIFTKIKTEFRIKIRDSYSRDCIKTVLTFMSSGSFSMTYARPAMLKWITGPLSCVTSMYNGTKSTYC